MPESRPPSDDDRDPAMAPDALSSLVAFLRTRRSVRASLGYLAIGWVLFEFSEVAFRRWRYADLIHDIYLVIYIAGFFVVLTGAYLVLIGKHPLRSVGLTLLVLSSLGAGVGITMLTYRFFNAGTPAANESSARSAVVVTPPRPEPGRTQDSAPPPGPRTVAAVPPPASLSPQTGASGAASDVIAVRLSRIALIFGEKEERVMDAKESRPTPLLAEFKTPVTIRVSRYSSGHTVNLTDPRTKRSRPRMDLGNFGDRATDRITVATGCGDVPYDFTATLVGDGLVRVVLMLDRDAARQAVARAIELDRCIDLVN